MSFVFPVILRPRSQARESAEAFKCSTVSKANGLKTCVLDKHAYLSSLRAAASSAAQPAVRDEEAMYEAADVQITVTSQVSGLPCAHGTKVRPSGLFPSLLLLLKSLLLFCHKLLHLGRHKCYSAMLLVRIP